MVFCLGIMFGSIENDIRLLVLGFFVNVGGVECFRYLVKRKIDMVYDLFIYYVKIG